jgi:hypothetical protein
MAIKKFQMLNLRWPKMDLIATIIKTNCGDNWKFSFIANVAMESFFDHHVFRGNFSDNENFLAFILTNETNMLGWMLMWHLTKNGHIIGCKQDILYMLPCFLNTPKK